MRFLKVSPVEWEFRASLIVLYGVLSYYAPPLAIAIVIGVQAFLGAVVFMVASAIQARRQ